MEDLKKILKTTSKYITLLQNYWINNIEDLFLYFPRTYEDRTKIKNLNEILIDNNIQTIKWQVLEKKIFISPRWKKIGDVIFQDINWDIWYIKVINSTFSIRWLKKDDIIFVIWKPKLDKGKIIFRYPEIKQTWEKELEDVKNVQDFQVGKIYPVYSEMMWIKPSRFANKIAQNLKLIPSIFEEVLPKDFLNKYNLLDINKTIENLHFPQNNEILKKAQYRIYFEKLLKIQLISLLWKLDYTKNISQTKTKPDWEIIKRIITKLPFELTIDQKKVIKEIVEDFHKSDNILRLLQWDVWSWKTIVSIISAYYILEKFWWQIAFLAPTEVLATQHLKNIAKILLPFGIKISLLTWSTTLSEKKKIKDNIKSWIDQIIIWTHAIIQDDVIFNDLKFVVIDEQQKFGVKQRWFFQKFWSPYILQMTATPIPRSLAIAFFGEFEISTIKEMPLGRKEIHTKITSEKELNKFKPRFLTKISQWQQIYIVCPLIEESENLEEIKSATQEFEETKKLLPELKWQIWLLHGKMKSKEKEETMNQFKQWNIKVLVSTTVIEVWVDVPQATIIIIKNSERFWLSQLHQLRWRVWRNNIQSYCFMTTKSKNWDTYNRLKAMEKTNDWFELSKIDMINRGSGEILGIKQSGEKDIPIEILSDIDLLKKVQKWANELLSKYDNLNKLKNLKNNLFKTNKNLLI